MSNCYSMCEGLHYCTRCLLRSSSALLDISSFTTHMQDICPVHIHSLTAAWYSHTRTSPSSFQPVNQSYVNIRLIYEEPLRFTSIVVHMGAISSKLGLNQEQVSGYNCMMKCQQPFTCKAATKYCWLATVIPV